MDLTDETIEYGPQLQRSDVTVTVDGRKAPAEKKEKKKCISFTPTMVLTKVMKLWKTFSAWNKPTPHYGGVVIRRVCAHGQ